jgi:TonB family protein
MTEQRLQEPAVPVGLEQVLLMAGVEPRFAEALRSEPEAALQASGVALSATERAILRTVPGERLEQMAARLVAAVPEPTRRAFMGRASAVVVALGVGGGLAAGCVAKKSDPGKTATGQGGAGHGGAGHGGAGQRDAGEGEAMEMARQRTMQRRRRVIAPTGSRPGPWPRMTAGEPKIEGSLDKAIVKRNLGAYSHAVRQCWITKGRPHPPRGTLRLDLTVDSAGKVTRASLGAGTLKNNGIESCILAAVRGWKFSPSKPRPTRIQVEYKFEYRY